MWRLCIVADAFNGFVRSALGVIGMGSFGGAMGVMSGGWQIPFLVNIGKVAVRPGWYSHKNCKLREKKPWPLH